MSIRVMTQVWEHSRAKKGQLLILLAIADFADDHGRAWPAVSTLAKKARITIRHTQKVIGELKKLGELSVDLQGSGRWGTNLFRINLKAWGVIMTGGGELEDRGGVSFKTQRGELQDTQTLNNHQLNHYKKKRDANPSDSSINEFLKVYVSCAPKLPHPREVTTGRADKIRQRMNEHDLDFWREAFTKGNNSPFLKGDNDRGWKADLDWFIANDGNAVKVLEGKYEKAKEKPTGQNLTDFDAIYRAQQEREKNGKQ